ncbi:MAG: hypothetical protein HKN25_11775 [Pyrinomonadaceae bacterium]|nr:hypothetical protein [Pyrinomonadaceae bacterium]
MDADFSGKVVGLVDAPANAKHIAAFKQKGADILRIPYVSTGPIEIGNVAETAIANLEEFDWIFFPDIYTVDIFFQLLKHSKIDPYKLDELSVCAFGEAVADRLRFVQVHSDLIPARLDVESLFKAVQDYVSDPVRIRALRILFPKAKQSEYEIVNYLRGVVKQVFEIGVYSSGGVSEIERTKVKTLINSGAIDEFVFFNVDDVQRLLLLFFPENLSHGLNAIRVTTVDAGAFQSLREHGLKPQLLKPL